MTGVVGKGAPRKYLATYVAPIILELRAERIKQNISTAALARRIGITRENISRWELGRTSPIFNSFVAWANSLGYDLALKERT